MPGQVRRVKALRASPKRKREADGEDEDGVDSTGADAAGEGTVNGEGGATAAAKAKRNTRRKNKERKIL